VATVAGRRPPRLHRVFRQGVAVILAVLAQGQPLPQGHFLPERVYEKPVSPYNPA
jgi:hypothetical protein